MGVESARKDHVATRENWGHFHTVVGNGSFLSIGASRDEPDCVACSLVY